ncbi:LUD domain-containing protein [Alphaproteobacteria bacterium]|jgi:hypothetical protein|nr:LUD domain-containing protein [Alphaproteobacteria bacterium]
MQNASDKLSDRPHVGLFVKFLVDIFRPQVGFAAVKLLKQSGCRVSGPTRTADIEQTILMGAHGPRRLHIIIRENGS